MDVSSDSDGDTDVLRHCEEEESVSSEDGEVPSQVRETSSSESESIQGEPSVASDSIGGGYHFLL